MNALHKVHVVVDAASWRVRARRIETFARRRDDAETYRRAAGLLARIYRFRLPADSIAGLAADMAARRALLERRS